MMGTAFVGDKVVMQGEMMAQIVKVKGISEKENETETVH